LKKITFDLLAPFVNVSLNEHEPSEEAFLGQNIYTNSIDRKGNVNENVRMGT
jgi:hypothetical protein